MSKPKRVKFTVPDDWGKNVEVYFLHKWLHGYFDEEEGGVYYFRIYAHDNPNFNLGADQIQLDFTASELTEDKIRRLN